MFQVESVAHIDAPRGKARRLSTKAARQKRQSSEREEAGTMCLSLLRCVGVTTVEKGDSDVEDRRVQSNGHYHPPKSTTAGQTAHSGEQQHPKMEEATGRDHNRSPKRATLSDESSSFQEASLSHGKSSSPRAAGNKVDEAPPPPKAPPKPSVPEEQRIVPGQPKKGARDESLHQAATVPDGEIPTPHSSIAKSPQVTFAGHHDTPHGRNAHGSTTPDGDSINYLRQSQAEETTKRGQSNAWRADDGRSSAVNSEGEPKSGGNPWILERQYSPSSPQYDEDERNFEY